jgi:hypothetical protein
MIGAKTTLTFFTFNKRVREPRDVPRRLPRFWVHENGCVDTVHVIALFDESAPPQLLEVVLKRYAMRTVVEGAGEATIDLRTWVHEPAALCERDQRFH